ncbi:MAG: hypothetical protein ACOYKZ_00800 [Chlamydiia bacterium]
MPQPLTPNRLTSINSRSVPLTNGPGHQVLNPGVDKPQADFLSIFFKEMFDEVDQDEAKRARYRSGPPVYSDTTLDEALLPNSAQTKRGCFGNEPRPWFGGGAKQSPHCGQDYATTPLHDARSPAYLQGKSNCWDQPGIWSNPGAPLPAFPSTQAITPPGRVQSVAHTALKISPTHDGRAEHHAASTPLGWSRNDLSTSVTARPYQPNSTQERPPQPLPSASSLSQAGQRVQQGAPDPGQIQAPYMAGLLLNSVGQGSSPPIFPHPMLYPITTGAFNVHAPGTFVFQGGPFALQPNPSAGSLGSPQGRPSQGSWPSPTEAWHPMQGGAPFGPWNSPPPVMQPYYEQRPPEQTYAHGTSPLIPAPISQRWPAPGHCGPQQPPPQPWLRCANQVCEQQRTPEFLVPQPIRPALSSSTNLTPPGIQSPLPRVVVKPRWPRGEALQSPSPTEQPARPLHMTPSPTSSLGSSDPRMSPPASSTAKRTSQEASPTAGMFNASPSSKRDTSLWIGMIKDAFQETAGQSTGGEQAATALQQSLYRLFDQVDKGIKVSHTAWGLLKVFPTQPNEFDKLESCASQALKSSLLLVEASGFRVLQTNQADHIQLSISRIPPTKAPK